MKFSLIVMAVLAISAVHGLHMKSDVKFADKTFLMKQKFIFEVLHNMHMPLKNEDYLRDMKGFVQNKEFYTNYDKVYKFFMMYKNGLIPMDYVFSIFNFHHVTEMKGLFYLFYYSRDWDTFYKNVLWARHNVNEGMFVYALSAAVIHRKDMQGIILPAHNEIFPYMYYNGLTISKIMNYKMQGFSKLDSEFMVMSNYTDDIMMMNDEGKLAYFTEDIGWNMYYYYFNLDYPFWLGGKDFNLYKDRRGEQYLYMHQQLLARYFLERLSNNMGEIPEMSWIQPIKTGYNPQMRYYNGLPFTVRKNWYEVYSTEDYYMLNRIDDFERRIRDCIDLGYFTDISGKKIDFMSQEGVDMLGNMIQSNPDSINEKFFGKLIMYAHMVLSGESFTSMSDFKAMPGVLGHFETSMRDPVFYQFYKRILRMFFQLKENLPMYKHEELYYSGVTFNKVDISKLVTYFDYDDSDVSTMFEMDTMYTNKMGDMGYSKMDSFNHEKMNTGDFMDKSYMDKSYMDKSYMDKSFMDKSYMDKSFMDKPYMDKSYADKFYMDKSYDKSYMYPSYMDKSYGDKSYMYPSYMDKSYMDKSYMDKSYMGKFYDMDYNKMNMDYDKTGMKYDFKYTGMDYNKMGDKYTDSSKYMSMDTDKYMGMYTDKFMDSDKYMSKDTDKYMGLSMKMDDSFGHKLKVRQMRLNHKPFTMNLDLTSDKLQTAVFRIYMGPKYDEFGKLFTINENRENFVEIDQFVYELKSGRNTIKRDSRDFYFSIKDRTMYSDLYKNVMMGLQGNYQFPLDMSESHCGFPDRLLLPKGWVSGMPMQFFFVVTPLHDIKQYSTYNSMLSCGIGSGSRFIDNLPFGYPFDRYIDETKFFTPNMFFKDVFIFHQDQMDMHKYSGATMMKYY